MTRGIHLTTRTTTHAMLEDVKSQTERETDATRANVSLAARGVRTNDTRGELTNRRSQELAASSSRVIAQERRTLALLKKEYTLAEKIATNGFKKTMIFGPQGGNYKIRKRA